eukprot:753178-Hanusia_phi.AAC.5
MERIPARPPSAHHRLRAGMQNVSLENFSAGASSGLRGHWEHHGECTQMTIKVQEESEYEENWGG